ISGLSGGLSARAGAARVATAAARSDRRTIGCMRRSLRRDAVPAAATCDERRTAAGTTLLRPGPSSTIRGMLFLLHGAPGDGSLWEPVVSRLAAGIRVGTPTFGCFGPGAEASAAAFGTAVHSRQLIEWLEAAHERPAAVAAWSYSTHVVLDALLQRPD